MTLYPKLILDALATVRYPGNGKNIRATARTLSKPKWWPTTCASTV